MIKIRNIIRIFLFTLFSSFQYSQGFAQSDEEQAKEILKNMTGRQPYRN